VITVRVDDAGVNAMLRRLRDTVGGNMKPAMAEIGQALTSNVQLGFKDSKDPWGDPWKPLSREALLARAQRFLLSKRMDQLKTKKGAWRVPILRQVQKIGREGQPLLDTGRLRSSITYNANASGVEVGTNVEYAPVHQFGGQDYLFKRSQLKDKSKWPKGADFTHRIPARPFMPIRNNRVDLPPVWQNEVINIIQRNEHRQHR
jgi:phage gpG-like protein